MSQSSVKSHPSVKSRILTPTLDEVFTKIESTKHSQQITVRTENIEVHDGKIEDLILEPFSLRNLGTNLSDLSLEDNIANLIETIITDQKFEADEKLIAKSPKEDDICAESQLTHDYLLSPEITYSPLKIYTINPEISNESRDKLSESIESADKFTPIDLVESTANTHSPIINLKRKKRLSVPLSQSHNIQTPYNDPPVTVATSQSGKCSNDEVSRKRSRYDFNMHTSQLSIENSNELMKNMERMRAEDNILVNLSNSTFTHIKCSSYDTQPCSPSILPQQSKPACETSTSMFMAIASPKSTDLNAPIGQSEVLTNTSQQFLGTNQSTDTVTQCVRNTVTEPQIESDKLSFDENVGGVSDDKSLHKVGNSQQITVDGNNLMIKDTDTGDLAMSEKCATNAAGHASPLIIGEQFPTELTKNVFMYSERTKDLPNNENTNEKNTSDSCDDDKPKEFSITRTIDPATNVDLLLRNTTNISDCGTVNAKDSVPDEKDIASNPFEFDLTTITGENYAETGIELTDIEPAADTTLQKASKIIDEETEFDLSFLTGSQIMQIEKDIQNTADKSMYLSEQFDGKGTNNNDIADWDLNTQFPTESQLDRIESEVSKHDLVTDAAKPSSEGSVDNRKNTASDSESFQYSILTPSQVQNIDRQINLLTANGTSLKSTTNMDCLRRAVLQNKNDDTNVFYNPDIKDRLMNIIENTLSLPNWVEVPVAEPDYEKMKSIIQTRRQQIHKMLEEIRRLSSIVTSLKDIPLFEQSNANLNQTPQQNSPHPQPVNEFYTTEKNSTNRCTNLPTFTNEHQLQNTKISTTKTPIAESSNTYYTADSNQTKFHTSSILNQANDSIPLKNVPNVRKEYGDLVTSCKIPNIFGVLKYHANDKKNEPVQSTNVWFNAKEIENSNVVNENNHPPQVQIPSTSTCSFYNETNVISNDNAETCTSNNTTDSNIGNSMFYSSVKK